MNKIKVINFPSLSDEFVAVLNPNYLTYDSIQKRGMETKDRKPNDYLRMVADVFSSYSDKENTNSKSQYISGFEVNYINMKLEDLISLDELSDVDTKTKNEIDLIKMKTQHVFIIEPGTAIIDSQLITFDTKIVLTREILDNSDSNSDLSLLNNTKYHIILKYEFKENHYDQEVAQFKIITDNDYNSSGITPSMSIATFYIQNDNSLTQNESLDLSNTIPKLVVSESSYLQTNNIYKRTDTIIVNGVSTQQPKYFRREIDPQHLDSKYMENFKLLTSNMRSTVHELFNDLNVSQMQYKLLPNDKISDGLSSGQFVHYDRVLSKYIPALATRYEFDKIHGFYLYNSMEDRHYLIFSGFIDFDELNPNDFGLSERHRLLNLEIGYDYFLDDENNIKENNYLNSNGEFDNEPYLTQTLSTNNYPGSVRLFTTVDYNKFIINIDYSSELKVQEIIDLYGNNEKYVNAFDKNKAILASKNELQNINDRIIECSAKILKYSNIIGSGVGQNDVLISFYLNIDDQNVPNNNHLNSDGSIKMDPQALLLNTTTTMNYASFLTKSINCLFGLLVDKYSNGPFTPNSFAMTCDMIGYTEMTIESSFLGEYISTDNLELMFNEILLNQDEYTKVISTIENLLNIANIIKDSININLNNLGVRINQTNIDTKIKENIRIKRLDSEVLPGHFGNETTLASEESLTGTGVAAGVVVDYKDNLEDEYKFAFDNSDKRFVQLTNNNPVGWDLDPNYKQLVDFAMGIYSDTNSTIEGDIYSYDAIKQAIVDIEVVINTLSENLNSFNEAKVFFIDKLNDETTILQKLETLKSKLELDILNAEAAVIDIPVLKLDILKISDHQRRIFNYSYLTDRIKYHMSIKESLNLTKISDAKIRNDSLNSSDDIIVKLRNVLNSDNSSIDVVENDVKLRNYIFEYNKLRFDFGEEPINTESDIEFNADYFKDDYGTYRSDIYHNPKGTSEERLFVKNQIEEVYTENDYDLPNNDLKLLVDRFVTLVRIGKNIRLNHETTELIVTHGMDLNKIDGGCSWGQNNISISNNIMSNAYVNTNEIRYSPEIKTQLLANNMSQNTSSLVKEISITLKSASLDSDCYSYELPELFPDGYPVPYGIIDQNKVFTYDYTTGDLIIDLSNDSKLFEYIQDIDPNNSLNNLTVEITTKYIINDKGLILTDTQSVDHRSLRFNIKRYHDVITNVNLNIESFNYLYKQYSEELAILNDDPGATQLMINAKQSDLDNVNSKLINYNSLMTILNSYQDTTSISEYDFDEIEQLILNEFEFGV